MPRAITPRTSSSLGVSADRSRPGPPEAAARGRRGLRGRRGWRAGEALDQAAGHGRREQRVAGADELTAATRCSGVTSLSRKPLALRTRPRTRTRPGRTWSRWSASPRPPPPRFPGRLDAVQPRHPDVHQHDVGPVLEHRRDRLLAVGGLGQHVDAGRLQDQPEAAPYQRLIVGDHRGHRPRAAGTDAAARHRAAGHDAAPVGMTARTCQPPPGRGPAASSPP